MKTEFVRVSLEQVAKVANEFGTACVDGGFVKQDGAWANALSKADVGRNYILYTRANRLLMSDSLNCERVSSASSEQSETARCREMVLA